MRGLPPGMAAKFLRLPVTLRKEDPGQLSFPRCCTFVERAAKDGQEVRLDSPGDSPCRLGARPLSRMFSVRGHFWVVALKPIRRQSCCSVSQPPPDKSYRYDPFNSGDRDDADEGPTEAIWNAGAIQTQGCQQMGRVRGKASMQRIRERIACRTQTRW